LYILRVLFDGSDLKSGQDQLRRNGGCPAIVLQKGYFYRDAVDFNSSGTLFFIVKISRDAKVQFKPGADVQGLFPLFPRAFCAAPLSVSIDAVMITGNAAKRRGNPDFKPYSLFFLK